MMYVISLLYLVMMVVMVAILDSKFFNSRGVGNTRLFVEHEVDATEAKETPKVETISMDEFERMIR